MTEMMLRIKVTENFDYVKVLLKNHPSLLCENYYIEDLEPVPPKDWEFLKETLDIIKETEKWMELYPDDLAIRLSLESLTRFLNYRVGIGADHPQKGQEGVQ